MNKIIITLPSMTFSQKARGILSVNGVDSKIIKLSPELAQKGCGWALEIDSFLLDEAVRVLNISDIPIRRIIRNEV